MKAIKKSIEVEVWQVPDTLRINNELMPEWIMYAINQKNLRLKIKRGGTLEWDRVIATILTPEGKMKALDGDYIIKGVKGEIYPCRKDIFEETYEVVND